MTYEPCPECSGNIQKRDGPHAFIYICQTCDYQTWDEPESVDGKKPDDPFIISHEQWEQVRGAWVAALDSNVELSSKLMQMKERLAALGKVAKEAGSLTHDEDCGVDRPPHMDCDCKIGPVLKAVAEHEALIERIRERAVTRAKPHNAEGAP